jgi:hypothetical protein
MLHRWETYRLFCVQVCAIIFLCIDHSIIFCSICHFCFLPFFACFPIFCRVSFPVVHFSRNSTICPKHTFVLYSMYWIRSFGLWSNTFFQKTFYAAILCHWMLCILSIKSKLVAYQKYPTLNIYTVFVTLIKFPFIRSNIPVLLVYGVYMSLNWLDMQGL